MKKITCFLMALCLISSSVWSQLPNGSPAQDFSVTTINGGSVSLFALMGSNKAAALDFSATWCGPCWSFHQSGVLEQVHTSLANECTVMWIEADFNTNTECIYNAPGCVGGTQGDWTTGVGYPIIDLTSTNGPEVKSDYGIGYYPTLYVISPDKRVWEIRNRSFQSYEDWITKSFKMAATAAVTNSVCGNDGKIVLTVTQGYSSKTYKWSNGATTKDLVNIPAGSYDVTITDLNGYFIERGPFNVGGATEPLSVSLLKKDNVKCYGETTGEIEVDANGATPGYTFNWSNGMTGSSISGLPAGNYKLTVTDVNNCKVNQSYDITQPAELLASALTTEELCDGKDGSITVLASGGVRPFIYNIGKGPKSDNYFPDLEKGAYRILVLDANGCEEEFDVFLDGTDAPKVEAGANKELNCINPKVALDGTGSAVGKDYTYKWTTKDGQIISGDNTLYPEVGKAGTYVLKVTSAGLGCVSEDKTIVTENKVYPSIKVGPGQELTCTVKEVQLNVDITSSPVTIKWTGPNGFTSSVKSPKVTAPGTYKVEVKSPNGCASLGEVIVTDKGVFPNALMATALKVRTVKFTDKSIGSPKTWAWVFGDGGTSNEQNPTHTYAKYGTYTVCLTITNDCGENVKCFKINVGIPVNPNVIGNDTERREGTEDPFLGSNERIIPVVTQMSVYPNPVNQLGNIQLEFSAPTVGSVRLINSLGSTVWSDNVSGNAYFNEVNVTTLQSGVYFLAVENEGNVQMFKWIVQK